MSKLNQLPVDERRFDAGDLEHGEAVDLDDSSWRAVKRKWRRRTKRCGIAAESKCRTP
jgi:hypothetical protein